MSEVAPDDLVPVAAPPDDLVPVVQDKGVVAPTLAKKPAPEPPGLAIRALGALVPATQLGTAPDMRELAANVLPSAKKFGEGMLQTFTHPIDTLQGLGNVFWGAAEKALPDAIVKRIPGHENHQQAAAAIGQFLVNRYGSPEAVLESMKTDPVGVMADASMLLGGTGSILSRLPATTKVGSILEKAGTAINPADIVAPAISKMASTLAKVPNTIIGDALTLSGAKSLETAYDAGKTGNPAFWDNFTGKVPYGEAVDSARQALTNMRNNMKSSYKLARQGDDANITFGWADDATPLDFSKIELAYDNALKSHSFKGVAQPGVADIAQEVRGLLDTWKAKAATDPSFATVEGLDALKQHLNSIYPKDVANRTGRAFASSVTKNVKQAIVDQVPQYADAMKDYWQRTRDIDEIERSLSLGDRASVDTGLRKLQSLTRNNVSTNYGNRLSSAEKLKTEGGVDIMPAVAGQALNSWLPRGAARWMAPFEVGAGGYLAGMNPSAIPYILTAAATQSPKLMGGLYYGLGKGAGTVNNLFPSKANAALLAGEMGKGYAGGGLISKLLVRGPLTAVKEYSSAIPSMKEFWESIQGIPRHAWTEDQKNIWSGLTADYANDSGRTLLYKGQNPHPMGGVNFNDDPAALQDTLTGMFGYDAPDVDQGDVYINWLLNMTPKHDYTKGVGEQILHDLRVQTGGRQYLTPTQNAYDFYMKQGFRPLENPDTGAFMLRKNTGGLIRA